MCNEMWVLTQEFYQLFVHIRGPISPCLDLMIYPRMSAPFIRKIFSRAVLGWPIVRCIKERKCDGVPGSILLWHWCLKFDFYSTLLSLSFQSIIHYFYIHNSSAFLSIIYYLFYPLSVIFSIHYPLSVFAYLFIYPTFPPICLCCDERVPFVSVLFYNPRPFLHSLGFHDAVYIQSGLYCSVMMDGRKRIRIFSSLCFGNLNLYQAISIPSQDIPCTHNVLLSFVQMRPYSFFPSQLSYTPPRLLPLSSFTPIFLLFPSSSSYSIPLERGNPFLRLIALSLSRARRTIQEAFHLLLRMMLVDFDYFFPVIKGSLWTI